MPDGPLRGPSPSHRQQPTLVIEVFEIKAVRRTAVDCERQTTDEAVHAARRNALPQKSASNLMVVRPGSTLLSGSEVRFFASGPVARRTLLLPRGVGLAPRAASPSTLFLVPTLYYRRKTRAGSWVVVWGAGP